MKAEKKTKKISLNLNYTESYVNEKQNIFVGGVAKPKYIKELVFNISDDYDFNIETEEFVKNNMFSVEISGSNRALKEFGKFLINLALYKTKDFDYHEHLDNIHNYAGKPSVNITVRKY